MNLRKDHFKVEFKVGIFNSCLCDYNKVSFLVVVVSMN